MKKMLIKLLIIGQLIVVPVFYSVVFADPPGPPNPGNTPVGTGAGHGHPVGDTEGAPIGDGITLLITLGIAYGGYKIYENWKKNENIKTEGEPAPDNY